MSKIGNKVIIIPKGTNVSIKKNEISIRGPYGELSLSIKYVSITIEDNKIIVKLIYKRNKYKKYHGLYRSLINNMIIGVNNKFQKELLLSGVGYKVNMENNKLAFSIGFSHTVYRKIPPGLSVEILNQNKNIKIVGIDKGLVGLFASQVREIRVPECYLGKGIRYSNEIIIKKQGKTNTK